MNKKLLLWILSTVVLYANAQLNYNAANALNLSGTYTDLAANGSTIAVANTDDANSAPVNIGFTFNYNGTAYTQFVLNTNGFIKLGATAPAAANTYYIGAQDYSSGGVFVSGENDMIAPFNMNLVGLPNAEYRVFTTGAAGSRTTTIQYKNVIDGFTPQYDNMSFQIKLYETSNNIDFVYGSFVASANPTDFRLTAVGLVGSAGSVIAVQKSSIDAWATGPVFLSSNYTGNTHNHRNSVLPDPGRTYRFIPTSTNDASIREVYTFGEVSTLYTNPQTISAYIFNSGSATLPTFNATLSVTGANSYSNTVSIFGLAANTGTMISFTSYSNTTIGTNTVSVLLPNDGNNTNNTKSVTQFVTTSNINTAYGTVSGGSYGYNGSAGSFDVRYQISSSAGLTQVMPTFASSGVSYSITILDNNFNTIYSSPLLLTANGQNTISISPTIPVVNAFYVRYHQATTNRIELVVQNENPLRENTFFGNLSDQAFGSNQARYMSKVVLSPPPPPDVEVREVYTLGEVSSQFNNNHSVYANLKNNGLSTYSPLTVTLSVTGANTFSTTSDVYLNPGQAGDVYFSSFNLTNVGTNTITVSIPSDGNNTNNVKTVTQVVSANGINTAYGNAMNASIGFNGFSAEVGVLYNISTPARITHVMPTFSVSGQPYQIRINDGLSDIYTSGTLTTTAGQNTVVITPTVVATSSFYVYYTQLNTTSFQLGVQNENPVRSGYFFYNNQDMPNTGNNHRVMSKVLLSTPPPPDYAINEIYTYGEASSNYSNPLSINASIKNNGTYSPNITATISVTGANTFSTTVFIPGSINPGTSQEIYFSNFNIPNVGTNTITITLPADGNNGNNTKTITQVVTNNSIGFAYGNTMNSSLNNLSAGDYVYDLFNLSGPATVTHVVPTFSVGGAEYRVYVSDGSTTLFTSTTLTATAGANTVVISPPTAISSNVVRIFYEQVGSTPLNIALQNENPVRANIFGGSISGNNQFFAGHGINSRMMTKIVLSPPPPPDLTIGTIHSMGTVAIPNGNPQTISAYISNLNSNPGSNITVTLSVSGANTYSTTQTIGYIPGNVTNNSYVTFYGFNPSNMGTNTITISVPADANNGNNSVSMTQVINNSSFNYAYSSVPSSTSGIGFGTTSGTGDIATKFNSNGPALINQLRARFTSNGQPFTFSIYDDNFGQPGTAIYTSSVLTTNSLSPVSVSVSPAVSVSGNFYVIVSQTAGNIGLAYQDEIPVRSNTFYYATPTGAGNWSDFSWNTLNYRLMVEPIFGVCTPPAQPGAITGTNSICPNSIHTYSVAPVSGATSYVWNLPSGWFGSSTTNTISVTSNSNGGAITVAASNGCSSPTRSLNINVNQFPNQPTQIFGNSVVCSGTTQTYSVSPISGATSYNWSLPSGWSGSSATNTISVTTGTNAGNISASANNVCGAGSPQFLNITLAAGAPTQPTAIDGGTLVCQTSTQTYSIAAVSGAGSYIWTLPSGWSGSSTSNSISTTVGANSGTMSVIASNGCGNSAARILTVSVNNVPAQPSAISGPTNPCFGAAITYSVTNDPNATSYDWEFPGSNWIATGTLTTNIVNGFAGSSTVGSVTANNACGSSAVRTITVTTNDVPSQPAQIFGNSVVCSGTSQTFSVSPISGATGYNWTLPSGWIGSSATNIISVTTGTNAGNIIAAASNSCGASSSQTLAVTLAAGAPSQPTVIDGGTVVCQATTQTYSVAPVSGAGNYIWTLPSGWSGSSTSNTISATVSSNSGTVSVIASNGCGSSAAQTLSVTVNNLPNQPAAILGANSLCSGANPTYSVAADALATSYSWTVPASWTGTSTTNTISTTTGMSGTISVTANNGCGSSAAQTLAVAINSGAPSLPSAISGNSVVCQGSSQTYSVTNDPAVTSYNWTLPSGWSGTSTSNVINLTAGSNTGTVSVTAANGCGTTTAVSFVISTVNPLPENPGSINGSASLCNNQSSTYSVAVVSGATSYIWSLESGLSGSSTTNTISVMVGSSNGTISVVANNSCGSSSAQVFTISVNAGPTLTVQSSNATICSGESVTLSAAGATSYSWSTGATTSSVIVTPTTSTTYTVIGTTTGCSSSTTIVQNVNTCTGIDVANNSEMYSVYPNPNNGMFNVELKTIGTDAKVIIYNELGQVVYDAPVVMGVNAIKLSNFATGLYQLNIISGSTVKYRTKLVID
jgi:hypothetical protein